ncbi:RIP metalloprotease RseP [Prevotella sp.]|uniref:RIP metalloprotease RseP n=1 Tax=Prevotella sp. TaxID=59823 RepID=UPI002F94A0C8
MEVFLIRLLQFMLSISLLVLLHEGGHFFFSKLFGVRVEKFYLFFDPWFHLFEFKPKNSDTAYGLGWLPLGGYCKIAGMIDESMDTEQMKQPMQPWEFRAKPAWQRLLIMVGGVLVNFLLALFIYSMIMFAWGEDYVLLKDMKMGMRFNKEAKSYGFQDGDILLGSNEGRFKDFNADVFRTISRATRVDVLRDGRQVSIPLSGDINLLGMLKSTPAFCRPLLPAVIDTTVADSPAANGVLAPGYKIVAFNDKPIGSANEFLEQTSRLEDMMTAAKTHADSLKIRTVYLNYLNTEGDTLSTRFVLSPDLKLGVRFVSMEKIYKQTHVSYGFLESFPAGIVYGWNVLKGYVSDMQYVFSADGARSLGGFGAIGSLFPSSWDWYLFWKMTAFLSIILAFMNILPIPALDGGHVLFLVYEMVTGRKPSERFMIVAEYVGIGILMLLMIVANLNDILRWLGYMY